MIKLERPTAVTALKQRTIKYLKKRQDSANQYSKNSADIRSAWSAFLKTKARIDVADALDSYHQYKCAYCEQVAAKDIENFYPKSSYPRKMFRWTNLVRGCKNCNNAKLDKFPKLGNTRLLIDPCSDIDFVTGRIGTNPAPTHQRRAESTRDIFDLNQEPLREERRLKFDQMVYLLAKVIEEVPVTDDTKKRLQDELLPSRPWLGIVRQLFKKPGKYAPLVSKAINKLPHFTQWTADWL